MFITIALLALIGWGFAAFVRGGLLAWQVKQVAEGKRIPMVFSARGVQVPSSDALVLALGAVRWMPASAPARGRALRVGRREWRLGARGVEWRIDGRQRRGRGLLVLTDRRVSWRGGRDVVDIPLADVAHVDVRGPLLEIRRRSAPGDPLAITVPQPISVGQMVAALSAQALGYGVTVTRASSPRR